MNSNQLHFVMRPGAGLSLSWIIITCLLLGLSQAVLAEDVVVESDSGADWSIEEWRFQTSFYTKHWDPEPEHDNSQSLIAVEAFLNNHWIIGGAVFDNSFGQTSEYLYMGKQWRLLDSRNWYFKLTGGLLHGYKDEFKDKIPLNDLGIAPAIVPSIGFRYKRFLMETNILGNAAVTITGGFAF